MLSALTNYIWSSGTEDQTVPDLATDTRQQQTEDEWVLVDVVKGKTDAKSDEIDALDEQSDEPVVLQNVDILEESWYITPPSCFNASQEDSVSLQTSPLENLLIEHPSMSVYGQPARSWLALEESPSEQTPESSQNDASRETVIEQRTQTHGRMTRSAAKVEALTRQVQKNAKDQSKKNIRKKKLERQNQTHERVAGSRRKQKKVERKQGKHCTVYSNRGC